MALPDSCAWQVLLSTGYLCGAPDKVMTRLMDTFRMILLCMQPGAMAPQMEGWKAAMRVRMLHSRVRVMLRKRQYWDEKAWGVPINQEDLCATLLGFSLSTLKGIELVTAVPLSHRQRHVYLHMWRYIGSTPLLPSRMPAAPSTQWPPLPPPP